VEKLITKEKEIVRMYFGGIGGGIEGAEKSVILGCSEKQKIVDGIRTKLKKLVWKLN